MKRTTIASFVDAGIDICCTMGHRICSLLEALFGQVGIHFEYCSLVVYLFSLRPRRNDHHWLRTKIKGFSLCKYFPAYAAVHKRRYENCITDETFDNSQSGLYV